MSEVTVNLRVDREALERLVSEYLRSGGPLGRRAFLEFVQEEVESLDDFEAESGRDL